MPSTQAQKTFDTALELEKKIKSMAFNPKYDSMGYRTRVAALRECITELALAGEMGKLKKIAEYSLDLLEPKASSGTKRYHCLRPADLLYHLETFPTHQNALVRDISTDLEKNRAVINSIIKADFLESGGMGNAWMSIVSQLAEVNDKESWLRVVSAAEDTAESYRLITRTIGLFDRTFLEKNKSDFHAIRPFLQHKPNDFGWGAGSTAISSEALFEALLIVGCKQAIPRILTVGWLEFQEPFMLQRNMARYDFTPDDAYRRRLANGVHMPDGKYRHLATSYYQYELCRDEPLLLPKLAVPPSVLLEVIEQDGAQTPYGAISYLPGKIGELIDVTLKAALTMNGKDWDSTQKEYSIIPEKFLMKSKFFKGQKLTDDLGL